eukprot:m51a1_g4656 hypothetical protein (87) ;mRNA; f:44347-48377
MSLITTKIIMWSAEDQNKLFDEVSKIPGINTVSITSFEMSSLWKHPVETAVWSPEFITFFTENPTVRKGICKHIQAIWRNQCFNES